jgi:hypothetical protein
MSAAASEFDPLGLYVGGAVGQARDTYTAFGISDETRTGWKALAGLRPIPFLGGEVEYVDFGHAEGFAPVGYGPIGGGFSGTARATAAGIFGLGYLPIIPSYFSLYAKAGAERLHTSIAGFAPCAPPALCIGVWNVNHTENDFAYGAGAQTQFRRLAFRAEYERTSGSLGHPNLLSLGMTWTF